MHVLITGGAGYIGSHAAKAAAKAGFVPVVMDNLSRGYRDAVKWGPLIEADISDRDALRKAFREYSIGAIMHFAAYAYVGESMRAPGLYFENNVAASLDLLEIARQEGVKKIVFSSSCATYGTPQQVPIGEDHIQRPLSPYGESKLMVERILYWYASIFGLSCIALRYFNAAGADPAGELGENHDPETHLIPLAISAASGLSPALEIFGTDYDTPDGTAVRDYLHVTDLAEAHVAALAHSDQPDYQPGFSAFNLGTGKGYSVREVVAMVERVSGEKVPFKEVARRAGDPACLVADASRAGDVLAWRPVHSSLEEIVQTAWDWKTRLARADAV